MRVCTRAVQNVAKFVKDNAWMVLTATLSALLLPGTAMTRPNSTCLNPVGLGENASVSAGSQRKRPLLPFRQGLRHAEQKRRVSKVKGFSTGQPMQPTNTELAESFHQFVTIWKLIGKPFLRVDQTDRPGLEITWPDTHFPFYNALFLTEELTDAQVLHDRVQEAAGYMRARPNGGLFVLCLDNVRGAAKDSLPTIRAISSRSNHRGTWRFDSNESWMTQRYRISRK